MRIESPKLGPLSPLLPLAAAESKLKGAESSPLSSSSSASSDSDSDDCDDCDVPDEAYPAEFNDIEWRLSKGKSGCYHLLECDRLHCGRKLYLPESGRGLADTASSDHAWSPRCRAALPAAAKQWLDVARKS